MQSKLKKIALYVATATCLAVTSSSAYSKELAPEQIIVHPFQWSHNAIASECKNILGPKGFDGVQISPPAEHVSKDGVWWSVYQHVSFKNFNTRAGSETELKNMIKTCEEAGVHVYADMVFNQRGSYCDNGQCKGTGGSTFNPGSLSYPDMNSSNFHNNNGCRDKIYSYGNAWEVRNCRLEGMPDIATDDSATQNKIAEYFSDLQKMGVYGFRIDAAKHMLPSDIDTILGKVGNPVAYLEVIGAGGEPIQPGDYAGIDNAVVTEFKYCDQVMQKLGNNKNPYGFMQILKDSSGAWDVAGYTSEVFVNNHDNERGSAGTSYMNYKWGPIYNLAQSFMVAYPFGTIRQVYSGYEFSAHDPAGPSSDPTKCSGGWLCQHRVPIVANAVGFARATRGKGISSEGGSGNVGWFNRKGYGLYVANAGDTEITQEFTTDLPDGEYCEILQQDEKCGGQKVTVSGGKVTITVNALSAAAICLDKDNNGWCGGAPVDPCEKDPSSDKCFCSKDENKELDRCLADPTHEALYYAGTTNKWTFDPLTFDKKTRKWSIKLNLTGEGDTSGSQRFKITGGPDWKTGVWGDGGNHTLCSNEATCPDVKISEVGSYTLYVDDQTMSWSLDASTNEAPIAKISASATTITAGQSVTLDGSSSTDPDGKIVSYKWSTGETTNKITVKPTATTTYWLIVTDDKGLESAKVSKKITVSGNATPTVSYTYKTNGLYFKATTTASDADGDTLTYKWDLGDGSTSTAKSAGHYFAKAGTYKVSLTASDGKTQKTVSKSVTVDRTTNTPPKVAFSYTTQGLYVKTNNSTTDVDNDALTYKWDFGDGATSTAKSAGHTYSKAGSYTVTLTVSDGKLSSKLSKTVKVDKNTNTPPKAGFTYTTQGLYVKTTNTSSDVDENNLTYKWDFGDGATTTVVNGGHTYSKAGSYTITLTVNDGKLSTKISKTITVDTKTNTPPIAGFTYSIQGLVASFTNTSKDYDGDTLTYKWNFGDGKSSTSKSPKHTYAQKGTYTVKLTISDGKLTNARSYQITVK